MYTNTVVRCCTDVFLADSLHVLLTVHLLNYGLHCQNKMHRKSKWMIYHWGSIFILWTNKRFASCKTYDSHHFKYDVRSLKRAMCDMRCAFISMNVRAGLLRIFQPFFKNLELFSTAETILFAFALLLSYLRNYRRALNRLHSLCW